jgi:hypothetical protein
MAFVGKASSLPFVWSSLGGNHFAGKYKTKVVLTTSDKHSSLLLLRPQNVLRNRSSLKMTNSLA